MINSIDNNNYEKRELIKEYFVLEDKNEAGLKRGHKVTLVRVQNRRRPIEVYQMEDFGYAEIFEDGAHAIFCVFDGHGGFLAAEACKKNIPELVRKQLNQEDKKSKTEGLDFISLFQEAENQLEMETVNDPKTQIIRKYDSEGTTVSIIHIYSVGEKRFLQAANVGDSSAFLCRNKKAISLTEDHNMRQQPERRRLEDAGILSHGSTETRLPNYGLAVTRALGDFCAKNEQNSGLISLPNIFNPIQLTEEDSFIILASDGLWDTISGQDAIDNVFMMDKAQNMANSLMEIGLACQDNVTVIVIRL